MDSDGKMAEEQASPQAVCHSVIFFCSKGMIEGVVVFLFIWLLIQVLLNKQQEVHLQVLLGAGLALLCFCLLLGCAICWHKSRKQQSSIGNGKDSVQQGCGDIEISDDSERSISVTTQNQYQTLEPSTKASDAHQAQHEQNAISDRCSYARASLPSLYQLPTKTKRILKRHSTVLGDYSLQEDRASLVKMSLSRTEPDGFSGVKQKAQPLIHFSLHYSLSNETLTVNVTGFSNLPKRFSRKRDLFVRAYLLPRFMEPQYGHTENSDGGQRFVFISYSPEDLRERTLRLAVYSRDRSTHREGFFGELVFPFSQVDWHCLTTSELTRELTVPKTKLKKSLSTMDVFSTPTSPCKSPGQILILLQHQSLASRIKVMVQKAENLSKLTRIPGTPDHFVSIRLIQDSQVIDVKETRTVSGSNPVWNAPFLFDAPLESVQSPSLCLEFLVMQGRIYSRGRVLGRVLIGAGSSVAGMAHWQEMCSKSPVECSRWHTLDLDVL